MHDMHVFFENKRKRSQKTITSYLKILYCKSVKYIKNFPKAFLDTSVLLCCGNRVHK